MKERHNKPKKNEREGGLWAPPGCLDHFQKDNLPYKPAVESGGLVRQDHLPRLGDPAAYPIAAPRQAESRVVAEAAVVRHMENSIPFTAGPPMMRRLFRASARKSRSLWPGGRPCTDTSCRMKYAGMSLVPHHGGWPRGGASTCLAVSSSRHTAHTQTHAHTRTATNKTNTTLSVLVSRRRSLALGQAGAFPRKGWWPHRRPPKTHVSAGCRPWDIGHLDHLTSPDVAFLTAPGRRRRLHSLQLRRRGCVPSTAAAGLGSWKAQHPAASAQQDRHGALAGAALTTHQPCVAAVLSTFAQTGPVGTVTACWPRRAGLVAVVVVTLATGASLPLRARRYTCRAIVSKSLTKARATAEGRAGRTAGSLQVRATEMGCRQVETGTSVGRHCGHLVSQPRHLQR